PVEREPEALHLRLHRRDVAVRPLRRRNLVRHRGVLGGQAERVPAHRLQHVISAHPVVPGENVADGIVPHVPHVQLPRGVGEHAEAVELRSGGVFLDVKRAALLPECLGVALDCLRIVSVLHGKREIIGREARMKSALLFLATLLLWTQSALAQVAATVEGVQMPAWVERAGQRTPLAPGMELRGGDQVVTGPGARLVVKLSEGSLVKLGENGSLRFAELSPGRDLFRAALNVLEGAFRFTTDALSKGRKREVSVRVAQVTAGIRGTDLWGRSRAGNEIVCLIEGEIEVAADGEQPVAMNQPLQFYRRESGKTQPVGTVRSEEHTS